MSNPEKIALLTDSTADLPAPMREGKPIYVAVSYTHLDVYKRQPLKLITSFASSQKMQAG